MGRSIIPAGPGARKRRGPSSRRTPGRAGPAPEEADAELALAPEQEAELDRRLADLDAHPEAGVPWPQVQAELAATRQARGGGRRA